LAFGVAQEMSIEHRIIKAKRMAGSEGLFGGVIQLLQLVHQHSSTKSAEVSSPYPITSLGIEPATFRLVPSDQSEPSERRLTGH
jgi:hypothetical protein